MHIRRRICYRAAFEKETGVKPGLAVIIVGEDPASQIYVRNKGKACEEVGLTLTAEHLSQFEKYYNLLVEWNEKINLTASKESLLVPLVVLLPI